MSVSAKVCVDVEVFKIHNILNILSCNTHKHIHTYIYSDKRLMHSSKLSIGGGVPTCVVRSRAPGQRSNAAAVAGSQEAWRWVDGAATAL